MITDKGVVVPLIQENIQLNGLGLTPTAACSGTAEVGRCWGGGCTAAGVASWSSQPAALPNPDCGIYVAVHALYWTILGCVLGMCMAAQCWDVHGSAVSVGLSVWEPVLGLELPHRK